MIGHLQKCYTPWGDFWVICKYVLREEEKKKIEIKIELFILENRFSPHIMIIAGIIFNLGIRVQNLKIDLTLVALSVGWNNEDFSGFSNQ